MRLRPDLQPIVDPDPEHAVSEAAPAEMHVSADDPALHPQTYDAATLLVQHLFTPQPKTLNRLEYAIEYRLAQGDAGGDVVDVYLFDNGSVAFSVSDIAGKGPRAAVHAALIKFGLRAYASEGLTSERVLQSLNRLCLENGGDEGEPTFATVFFGHVDAERRVMGYASAAHDTVFMVHPNERAVVLPTTAPLLGVFDTQVHLFAERYVEIVPGTVLVAVTDGVTDARRGNIEFFGIQRVLDLINENFEKTPMTQLAKLLMTQASDFWDSDHLRDDMAVLAVRFL